MTTNKWWQNSVVYQIYPKSFQDSNNDGIGDLRGIINRLDYIKKLGVDIIWLNPIYRSPNIDNGYDISDYQAIQPDFGSMADFQEFMDKVHQKGMKLMMDLVVNHSSDEHAWFKASRQGLDNPKRDYYIWRNPVNGHAPTNWGSYFSGTTWTLDESSGQYYLHLFAKEQPDLNWESPQLRYSVYDMMNWWADKGVDGFRMDVINLISKPNQFQDGPVNPGETYASVEPIASNGPHVHQYLQEMNTQVAQKHDLVTVGETPAASPEDAKQYANLAGTELNMIFQFEHMGLDANENPALGKWSDRHVTLNNLRTNLTKWQTALAGKAWNSLYWNNHDQPRVVSRFGNDQPDYRVLSAKMLATMLHFMQGTPYIYQGEELGMTNAYFDNLTDYQDLETLNIYQQLVHDEKLVKPDVMMNYLKIHSRDNARTPMQWDTSLNAGFSKYQPWLAVNPNYPEINAKAELADEHSVFHYYRQLIKFRHTLPVITDGHYQLVKGNETDPAVFTYTRTNDDTKLIIILNFTNQTLIRDYQLSPDKTRLISNYPDDLDVTLRPYEAKVYKL